MKSPRDWLFDRHQVATPQLNIARGAALPIRRFWPDLARELFLPHRTAWRIIATAWVALALFHLTLGRRAQTSALPTPSPAALAALMAQFDLHDALAQDNRLP
jgi:hypothetical protein